MPQGNPGQFAESAQCVCYIHVWRAFVFREDCDQSPLVRSYVCRLIMAAYKQLAFNHRHWALWPSRKCYNVSFCIGYKLAKPWVYMCMHFSNQDQTVLVPIIVTYTCTNDPISPPVPSTMWVVTHVAIHVHVYGIGSQILLVTYEIHLLYGALLLMVFICNNTKS